MTTSLKSAPEGRGLGGRHVLAAMLAFFGVIIVADATMIYKAVTTFGGVDNVNAYRDGLAYNARIASAERQSDLGWHDTVEVLTKPERLRVALSGPDGKAPAAKLKVDVTIGRPATIRSDMSLHLAEVAPGIFEAPISDAGDGAWIATVRVFRDGDGADEAVYQIRRRLWIKR